MIRTADRAELVAVTTAADWVEHWRKMHRESGCSRDGLHWHDWLDVLESQVWEAMDAGIPTRDITRAMGPTGRPKDLPSYRAIQINADEGKYE